MARPPKYRHAPRAELVASCHPQRAHASRGMCQPCYKKWLKDTPESDRPPATLHIAGRGSKSAAAECHPNRPHRAKGLCQKCYLAYWHSLNERQVKERRQASHFLRKYGITMEQREQMLARQNGKCALCFKPPAEGKSLHVDHCHSSGKVRGMLCHLCNNHLGIVDADPSVLDRIKAYR